MAIPIEEKLQLAKSEYEHVQKDHDNLQKLYVAYRKGEKLPANRLQELFALIAIYSHPENRPEHDAVSSGDDSSLKKKLQEEAQSIREAEAEIKLEAQSIVRSELMMYEDTESGGIWDLPRVAFLSVLCDLVSPNDTKVREKVREAVQEAISDFEEEIYHREKQGRDLGYKPTVREDVPNLDEIFEILEGEIVSAPDSLKNTVKSLWKEQFDDDQKRSREAEKAEKLEQTLERKRNRALWSDSKGVRTSMETLAEDSNDG